MKNSTKLSKNLITAISLTVFLASSSAMAKDPKISDETKVGLFGAVFTTTAAIAGTIAAGPIGFIVGTASGVFIGEKGMEAVKNKQALTKAENSLSTLRSNALEQERKISRLEKSAANKLEFMVLFPTGEDELSHQDIQRVHSLANYMNDNPQLRVRIDGHADPRGTDEYNNVLSEERAVNVVSALEERGIDKHRIDYFSHGSDLSNSYDGNLEAYALERKVHIEVYSNASQNEVAANP
ncbi:OmpA family protein [Teredinibacter haidensis]|uniref:OmpA family protein n=1 Tax=Teredinibacter haidensis TaxID=2731755 RepID=UPI000948EF87|nr:OmpA family protein [Teredinibacter haidensis]